jgi:hypothetical protein
MGPAFARTHSCVRADGAHICAGGPCVRANARTNPCGEKLVCERGAGSGERGTGISSPFFLEFPAPWRGRPITVDYKCVDFYKIVEVASITVVIKMGTEGG